LSIDPQGCWCYYFRYQERPRRLSYCTFRQIFKLNQEAGSSNAQAIDGHN